MTYPLMNVVTITLCAVLCSADDFVAIAEFGQQRRAWLRKFLGLSAGIPSHDRFNAILGALKPAEFEQCLLSWITALHQISGGQIVAIDGKTLRRSLEQVGHPHGQRVGHGELYFVGPGGVGQQEQRDHRDPQTVGNAGDFRVLGDHRRDGLSDGQ